MKQIFRTIISFMLLLAVPLPVGAEEPSDSVADNSGNMFQRSAGAVKNFFRGAKNADAQKQTKKNTSKADAKDKSSKKPATREVAEKNYTVEQLYELSLTDNLKIPKLGSQKSTIRNYQLVQAKKLLAAGQETVETMRNGEVVIVTVDTDNLFYPNETTLKPTAGKFLSPFVKFLNVPDFYRMMIVVHSDNTGSESYTDELTNRRAVAILEWFKSHATCSDYVIPYGMGSSEPLYLNNSMENREKNRRLEIFLVPGKKMISEAAAGRLD
ncbi:MAG: OmpA family protein [Bacteroidales bacterium]|nr:OmpA family protein [Bacteroidales bacterium]MDD6670080.1 OmpA family protein [Bacteroidales bacterium]